MKNITGVSAEIQDALITQKKSNKQIVCIQESYYTMLIYKKRYSASVPVSFFPTAY